MDVELRSAARAPHLKAASFRLKPGLTVLEGDDGRAQAACLRLLALRWTPTAGHVVVEGRDMATMAPRERSRLARRIGLAPASRNLPPHLSVESALSYLASLWQVSARPAVARELDRWDLVRVRRVPLAGLSPGEQHRFVLAASLLMDPTVWLLEHPFRGLDVPGRTLLRHLLLEGAIGETTRRIVLVDEDVDLYGKGLLVASRLVASGGRIVELDPPHREHERDASRSESEA